MHQANRPPQINHGQVWPDFSSGSKNRNELGSTEVHLVCSSNNIETEHAMLVTFVHEEVIPSCLRSKIKSCIPLMSWCKRIVSFEEKSRKVAISFCCNQAVRKLIIIIINPKSVKDKNKRKLENPEQPSHCKQLDSPALHQ